MGQIINGKEIALEVKKNIKSYIENRISKGLMVPKIVSILIGEDGGSIYYMNNQEKVAKSLGCKFEKLIFSSDTLEGEIIDTINKLNHDKETSGIILQLPLPKGFDEKKIVSSISSKKDIDCLTYESQGMLYMGSPKFLPCTPNSVITILEYLNIDLEGKEAVVIGRSNIVGKPVAKLLLDKNATVTICHSKSKNIKEIVKKADIVIVAIGKPKFINSEYIKAGAILIDVGTTPVEGKLVGDVDFEDVIGKASLVTPVPGGVGALTTTLLIKNVCEALEKDEN